MKVFDRRGGRADAHRVDVVSRESVDSLFRETVAAHKRVDHAFNNAGISIAGDFRDLEPVHWQCVLEVNLWGLGGRRRFLWQGPRARSSVAFRPIGTSSSLRRTGG